MNKIIISLILILTFLFLPRLSKAIDWWNISWSHRKSILIFSNNTSNFLFDYQIPINITHKSHMQMNFGDIRFTYYNFSNGKEYEIPYFIEEGVSGSYVYVWIKAIKIFPNETCLIYMYYGNPNVETNSDPKNTFVWFDDASSDKSSNYNHVLGSAILSWDSINKNYIVSTGTNNIWLIDGIEIKDVEIRGSFMFSDVLSYFDNNQFAFVTRYSNNSNYYLLREETRPEPDQLDIVKNLNGSFGDIKNIDLVTSISFNTWYDHVGLIYKDKLISKSETKNQNVTTIDKNLSGNFIGFWTYRDAGKTFFDDLRVRKYVEPEPTISLGLEESYIPSKISIFLRSQKHIFANETFPIITTINYNENPLLNLNISNFELFFNNQFLTIDDIQDYNNGTYLLKTKILSDILGTNIFKLRLNYKGETEKNTTEIVLLLRPAEKVLIITDSNWQNYISSVSTRNPVLIYDSEKKYIDYFITKYQPDQIFLLGPSLTFPIKTYTVDSPDTLIKVFYNETNIIVPSNKEVAITSTMVNFPILFNPSDETIEYLDPAIIFNFSSIQEIEDIFIRRNPTIDYFILANKEHDNSILASSLAIKKNGFIILTNGLPSEFKDEMISKFNLFKLPDSYQFEQNIYLTLIEAPHFLVEDPVLESKNDDGNEIITDSPYADINGDEYLDLSLGRMKGSQEQISYQIEFSEMLKQNKQALIVSAYNTPGKVSDILYSGGTMPGIFLTELELRKRGFNVTKIVEKRVEYDELNFTILEKLRDIAEEFRTLSQTTYDSFFWEIFGDVSKIILIAKAGNHIIYPYHEFDWRDAWQSIITLEPKFPKHLPILNMTNLIKHTPENQVILYLSKGNATHWLIPENSTDWDTYYLTFDPSNIPFNPNFYYIHHPFGYNVSSKLLEKGTLASIGPTGNTYFFNSGIVGVEFFKRFENSIGKALTLTKNRNLEFSNFGKYTQKTYKKEYYTETLLGDPSLIFDPYLNLRFSGFVKCKHNFFTQTFYIKPEYYMASNNNEKFLIFENADDYLLILNKPAIPIYKKSFILPVGSEILDISVRGVSKKTFNDITLPIIYPDPEYFEKENFTGTYPEEIYWYYASSLLDDRKILDLFFSPIVYSSDGNAEVFKKIKVSVKYKSPFEISRLRATDTFKHKKSFIFFSVCNQLDRKIKANTTFRIQTSEFEDIVEREFTFRPGLNFRMLKYENTTQEGDYSVSMVLKHEDIIAGPKYTSFKVKDKHWPCFRDYCKK